jgi:nitroimidazol reductase NimA-like FMN-containing flavoprotein (pyridoxamine 5'-phosphate oxidase superfamily)
MSTDVPTDHSELRVMGADECLERLASVPLGRVGFSMDGEVVVLPVHHVVKGMDVYFLTSGGSKIEAAADHDPMGFEVDGYDEADGTGWSVSVSGTASVVVDDALCAELASLRGDRRFVGDPATAVWVVIRSDQISGRELLPR